MTLLCLDPALFFKFSCPPHGTLLFTPMQAPWQAQSGYDVRTRGLCQLLCDTARSVGLATQQAMSQQTTSALSQSRKCQLRRTGDVFCCVTQKALSVLGRSRCDPPLQEHGCISVGLLIQTMPLPCGNPPSPLCAQDQQVVNKTQ